MNKILLARIATLIGYFGLLILLLNWLLWISPPINVPRGFLLIVLVVPLLFPLRGLMYARRYTYQWSCFLALFYFIIGVDVWFNRLGTERVMGTLTVLFSLLYFGGAVAYSKFTGTGKKKKKSPQKS